MGRNSVKLSILIAYYNIEKYIGELLDALIPQIRDDVEVILLDDGSDVPFVNTPEYAKITSNIRVIRIEPNQGLSHARNIGIEEAAGDYLSFIDGDDVVSKDFVEQVLERIAGNPDYIELSWRALDNSDNRFNNKATATEKLANPSVCTRVFRKGFIGSLRFNELKDASEDEDFTRHLKMDRGGRAFVDKYVYFYRVDRENSLSMRFRAGLSRTRLIIYHYKHVTEDMTELLEEIKKEDEKNEVWLFTMKNDLPELEDYCRVRRPFHTWANELRGEPCSYVTVRESAINTQIVIYVSVLSGADGISTWIRNFCQWMHCRYSITVVYDAVPEAFLEELRPLVRVIKNKKPRTVLCDTVLMMRIGDTVPKNIKARRILQVVHTVNDGNKKLPSRDGYIYVSEASRNSFSLKGDVIYNLPPRKAPERTLTLVSTCRIDGSDKGRQNERMLKLCRMLRSKRIEFLWFYFSENSLTKDRSMVRIDTVKDVRPFLKIADYLVQLSDSEAYCYAITEALSHNVPVITTPLTVLDEIGFRDGIDGHVVPFDMDFDVEMLMDRERLDASFGSRESESVERWEELFGDPVQVDDYVPEVKVNCRILKPYFDMALQKDVKEGAYIEMWEERAKHLKNMGLVAIV